MSLVSCECSYPQMLRLIMDSAPFSQKRHTLDQCSSFWALPLYLVLPPHLNTVDLHSLDILYHVFKSVSSTLAKSVFISLNILEPITPGTAIFLAATGVLTG